MNFNLKESTFLQSKVNKMIVLFSILLSLFFSQTLSALTPTDDQNLPPKSNISIEHDQRPTDLEYVLMSKYAYDERLQKGDEKLPGLPGWRVYKVKEGKENLHYRGVVFKNDMTRQLVVAHRGTNVGNVKDLLANIIEDVQSVIRSKTSPQGLAAFVLVNDVVRNAKEDKYSVSFTGHSLGAFLAELSVFFCHNDYDYPKANAVTFENPGSEEVLEGLQSNIKGRRVPLESMDIIGYVASPNAINTFNHHIGSLYLVEPNLSNPSWEWDPTWYIKESHSIDNIVKYFNDGYSKKTDFSYYMSDWPIANWSSLGDFTSSGVGRFVGNSRESKVGMTASAIRFLYGFFTSQKYVYFKYTELEKDNQGAHYKLMINGDDTEKVFDITYNAHFPIRDKIQKKYGHKTSLPLKHFSEGMQLFLVSFYRMFHDMANDNNSRQRLLEEWNKAAIPEEVTNYLMRFMIEKYKDGELIVVLPDDTQDKGNDLGTPIHKFRAELSKYLQYNPGKIEQLLGSMSKDENHSANIGLLIQKGTNPIEIYNSTFIGKGDFFKNVNVDKINKIRDNDAKRHKNSRGIVVAEDGPKNIIRDSVGIGEKLVVEDDSPTNFIDRQNVKEYPDNCKQEKQEL